jgi:rubredoxin
MSGDDLNLVSDLGDPSRPIPAAIPVQTDDEEIYCPVCGYNLTGVYSGRCPECGAFFDRKALTEAQQTNQITLIPWDDPEEMPAGRRFYETLRICLVRAERFAFAFSVQPRETRASSFFWIVTALTAVVAIGGFLMYVLVARPFLTWGSLTGMTVGIGAYVLLANLLTTVLAASILAVFCPHYDGRRRFRPWLSIAAYASAHHLLIAAVVPIMFGVGMAVDHAGFFSFFFVMVFAWLGCAMLCRLTLGAVVAFRTAAIEDTRFALTSVAAVYLGIPLIMLYVCGRIAEFVTKIVEML